MKQWKGFLVGLVLSVPLFSLAQDWWQATGVPINRALLNSAEIRSEFAGIDSNIADKLPALTGNGGKLIRVNAGATALEAISEGLGIAGGGTGAIDASGARTNLGLAIGTNVQAYDAELAEIAALADTDNNVIVGNGSAWVAESGATARASLGADSASNLTSGTLPDARLSGNVPLLDAAVNLFTGSTLSITATGPVYRWIESDQAADGQRWRDYVNGGFMNRCILNDAESVERCYMTVQRSGTSVSAVSIATGTGTNAGQFDTTAVAGNTRFLVFDVDNNTLERVSVDAADSCGSGFKCLRIPN